jgi:homoserine dehydrogenase
MEPDVEPLDLVLVGFGHVGRRLVRLLDELAPRLTTDYSLRPRVVGIATASHGCVLDMEGLDATGLARTVENGGRVDAAATRVGPGTRPSDALAVLEEAARSRHARMMMLETTPLDIVRGEPAISHIRRALSLGMDVITANKGPIAHAYAELSDLACERGVGLLFEGAVMDGAPIFNLVRRTLPAVTVVGFRGVVNSTTNMMLCEMERGGSAEAALRRMQAEGIAEADPSLDVEGWDAAAKTAALMNALMNARVTPQDIALTGIGSISVDDIERARRAGRRIKLVASARVEEGRVVGRVGPEAVEATDPLSTLDGAANGLIIETDLLGRLGMFQLDGHLTHTAYALISDMVWLVDRSGRSVAPDGRRVEKAE